MSLQKNEVFMHNAVRLLIIVGLAVFTVSLPIVGDLMIEHVRKDVKARKLEKSGVCSEGASTSECSAIAEVVKCENGAIPKASEPEKTGSSVGASLPCKQE